MKQVSNAITGSTVCFEIGEYKLESIKFEILRRKDSQLKNSSYNADGCHSTIIYDNFIELSLLEITGEFGMNSPARFTKDHIKGGFGALSLLQQIGYLFNYGSIETFSRILVYFIHAMGNEIRLWSLEQVSPGVCIMNLIHAAIIPTRYHDSEVCMREIGNLLWTYKLGLEATISKIHELYREHKNIELSISRRTMNPAAARKLSDTFEKGCVLKIKGEYIAGYEQLQVDSSI